MNDLLRFEIEKSKAQGRTTQGIRKYVFGVVDECLREQYGDNYSDRCFQSSMAIREVLKELGFKCRIVNGHVCMTKVSNIDGDIKFGWAGFWDKDIHVWAFNEFNELIDLTISHLHQHAASTSQTDLPIPAIWWDDVTRWPSTMIYLPCGIPIADFTPEEAQNAEDLMKKIQEKIKEDAEKISTTSYEMPILCGPESLQSLTEQRHPWVLISSNAQHKTMPPWVQGRVESAKHNFESSNTSGAKELQKKRAALIKEAQRIQNTARKKR